MSARVTREGGGFVVTAACKWLRWWASEKEAHDGRAEHEKKCKACAGGGGE